MNYYLDDIRQILTNQGFNNIYIDRVIEPSTLQEENEIINIISTGGDADPTITGTEDFEVYVYRRKNADAQLIARQLWNYLNGYSGGLSVSTSVDFRIITTTNKPQPLIVNNKNVKIYFFSMQAQINDSDQLDITR